MNGNAPNAALHSSRGPRSSNNYVVHHDFDGPAKLSTSIVHAISDVTGVDTTDAGFCLYDHVDPDALDQLFKPKPDGERRGNVNLSFMVWGYRVTVDSSGRIMIAPLQPRPSATVPPK